LTVPTYGGAPVHPGLTKSAAGFCLKPLLYEYQHPAAGGTDPISMARRYRGAVYHGSGIPN